MLCICMTLLLCGMYMPNHPIPMRGAAQQLVTVSFVFFRPRDCRRVCSYSLRVCGPGRPFVGGADGSNRGLAPDWRPFCEWGGRLRQCILYGMRLVECELQPVWGGV